MKQLKEAVKNKDIQRLCIEQNKLRSSLSLEVSKLISEILRKNMMLDKTIDETWEKISLLLKQDKLW